MILHFRPAKYTLFACLFIFLLLLFIIICLIKKITISSFVIGLKKTPISHQFTCQVVIGQLVIGQFVIRQFNEPITFEVVV